MRKNIVISRHGLTLSRGRAAMGLPPCILGSVWLKFGSWLSSVLTAKIHLLFGLLKSNKILITLWVITTKLFTSTKLYMNLVWL